VLEFFRAERPSPRTDEEIRRRLAAESERNWQQYSLGYRLYPFVVRAGPSNSIISTVRSHFNAEALANPHDPIAVIRPQLFDERLRRQAKISATRRIITLVDRGFTFEMVLDGENPHPLDRPARIEEEVHALADLPEITPSESSEDDMTGLLVNGDIAAIPVEEIEAHTNAAFSNTGEHDYSGDESGDDAEYDEYWEFDPTVSFLEWISGADASWIVSELPLSIEAALERDLDDYEHSYLGINRAGSPLVEFREARTSVRNRPYDFFPEVRPGCLRTLSFAAWACVQQQRHADDLPGTIETYTSYIEAVATLEQRAAFREFREQHFEANCRFFNYQMLEEDHHDFFRPHNIITPTRPSSWLRVSSRGNLMNFPSEVAEGMHRPVPPAEQRNEDPAVLQQHDRLPASFQNWSFHWASEDGEPSRTSHTSISTSFHSTCSKTVPQKRKKNASETGSGESKSSKTGTMAIVSDPAVESDPDSEAGDEDLVRVRANWFGSGRWPGDLPGNARSNDPTLPNFPPPPRGLRRR
jgi:hypothetical protein